MPNDSMIPRPPSLRDIRRDQEDEARRREQTTSARNTSSSTIGAGGMLTLDGGGLDVVNGGLGRIRDGGVWNVEGGGSMDITDDGQINAVGEGRHRFTREIVKVTASLANRMMTNLWESVTYLQAGLYFNTGGESRGALDPRVVSEDGKSVSAISSVEKLLYGPQVGPNIMAKSTYKAGPEHASIGAYAWDDSVNPGGGDGDTGRRGAGTVAVTPYDLSILLSNYTDGPDGIPSGPAFWINGTLEEGKLNIYTRNGLDVQGTFTVNGQPVGGGTWDSITGKPSTFPPSSHSHSTSQVTGLDTALAGKAPTSHTHTTAQVTGLDTALAGKAASTHTHAAASTTTAGFMSAADKSKLDGMPAGATAVSYYVATGSKEAYAAFDQAITTPVYQAAGSTANLGAPGAGQITISASGIYSVVLSLALFTSNTLATPKAVTGRTFIEVADGSGSAYARTTIALEEDQGTSNHAGLVLAAGSILKFNVLQNTGGIAHYRARIWVIKHP